MGRRKTYDGVIERVTEPAFSKKYNWWSFSVKHDGKWNSVTSRDKKSAQNQYKIAGEKFLMEQFEKNKWRLSGNVWLEDFRREYPQLPTFRFVFGTLIDYAQGLLERTHFCDSLGSMETRRQLSAMGWLTLQWGTGFFQWNSLTLAQFESRKLLHGIG